MAKRSTNFNGGAGGSARDRRNAGANLASLCDELGIDKQALAQRIAANVQAQIDACTWRVCWKRKASDAWTEELQPSRAAAIARKYALRDRLYIVAVQTKHADGTWIDG